MPRNEGFLDPGASPVASFACDLRALRDEAGKAPYRVLAKRAGFCASTLSVAASGAKLPSLDVTLAYVQACGGDPEKWRARWHELAEQHPPVHPGPNAQPGLQVAPPYDADEHGEPAQLDVPMQVQAQAQGQDLPSAPPVPSAPSGDSRSAGSGLLVAANHVAVAEDDGARPELGIRTELSPLSTVPTAHGRLGGGRSRRSGRRAVPVSRVATIVLTLATAALGLKVVTTEGTGDAAVAGPPPASASPADTPMQQADALYTLIYEYVPWSSGANDAIWDVNGCRNLSNAQSKLRTIARRRQGQVEELATLHVSKIPDSTRLVAALKHAWITSAQSDFAYANIAADLQTGCTTGAIKTDPNYQQADADAQAAATAKSEAATLWNDNADELGQLWISGAEL